MSASNWYLLAIICFIIAAAAGAIAVILFLKLKIPSVIGDLSGKTVAREIENMRKSNEAGVKRHRVSAVPDSDNAAGGDNAGGGARKAAGSSAYAAAHPSMRLDKSQGTGETGFSKGPGYRKRDRRTMKLPEEQAGTLGKRTQELPDSARFQDINQTEVLPDTMLQTEVLPEMAPQTEVLPEAMPQTDVLPETVVQANIQTDILSENSWQTDILPGSSWQTDILPGVGREGDPGYTCGNSLGTTFLDQEEYDPVETVPVPFRIIREYMEIHSDERIV